MDIFSMWSYVDKNSKFVYFYERVYLTSLAYKQFYLQTRLKTDFCNTGTLKSKDIQVQK